MTRHWMCVAYGRSFYGRSANEAFKKADAYAEKRGLRAQSLHADYY